MHKYKWAMTRLDKKGHITNSASTLPHKNLTQECMKLDLHLSLERVRMLTMHSDEYNKEINQDKNMFLPNRY